MVGDVRWGHPDQWVGRDASDELSALRSQRDELAGALRWIANNCKPYGPAQAHAHNSLRRCGLPLEFREEDPDGR